MKKAFLAPLAVLAAALPVGEAAAIQIQSSPNEMKSENFTAPSDRVSFKHNGDVFGFVLKRNSETGQMVAWHESHYSHSSHDSHSSHSSHYSGS
jgi:hypothetical protein